MLSSVLTICQELVKEIMAFLLIFIKYRKVKNFLPILLIDMKKKFHLPVAFFHMLVLALVGRRQALIQWHHCKYGTLHQSRIVEQVM